MIEESRGPGVKLNSFDGAFQSLNVMLWKQFFNRNM